MDFTQQEKADSIYYQLKGRASTPLKRSISSDAVLPPSMQAHDIGAGNKV